MAQEKRRPAPRINPHRGEALWNGFKLCLTMNALVEIETGLGVKLSKLGEALADPSMSDIRLILGALVRGGGAVVKVPDLEARVMGLGPDYMTERPISDEEVGAQMFDITEATAAIVRAFTAAGVFTPDAPGAPPGKL